MCLILTVPYLDASYCFQAGMWQLVIFVQAFSVRYPPLTSSPPETLLLIPSLRSPSLLLLFLRWLLDERF